VRSEDWKHKIARFFNIKMKKTALALARESLYSPWWAKNAYNGFRKQSWPKKAWKGREKRKAL